MLDTPQPDLASVVEIIAEAEDHGTDWQEAVICAFPGIDDAVLWQARAEFKLGETLTLIEEIREGRQGGAVSRTPAGGLGPWRARCRQQL
ncbi:hypothetical protein OPKNFCMD_6670 [Methylobacterium crusticola]|uniref:Uncharacterized protein n=1 Tax=Methylobacterium crusticola TaxID=1697972 RepID=A0ABQ4R973_9HYPH|nr:hypothetical protein [Methylobacterium crusticola]GJD53891.1 hypothetical protein OPKNFCMD_6670 [Methylobacterium crusticola]